jgi:hypothetical protein
MHDENAGGYQMWGQLVIHFLFTLPFKSTESDSRIGRAEKPERPAAQAIPKPDSANGKIQDIKIPQLPVSKFLKKISEPHRSGKNKG